MIIRRYGYGSYLEIGVNTPRQPDWNWPNVKISLKHGVDPNPKVHATFPVTSDEFFAKHAKMKYDIIFIDGLHLWEQAYKDMTNAIKFLEEGGTIVVHDCKPPSERSQSREHVKGEWSGDVWRAFMKLRMENPDIAMSTVDFNYGCGIIQKGRQELYKADVDPTTVPYSYFKQNEKEILNLISLQEFKYRMGRANIAYRAYRKIAKILGFKK